MQDDVQGESCWFVPELQQAHAIGNRANWASSPQDFENDRQFPGIFFKSSTPAVGGMESMKAAARLRRKITIALSLTLALPGTLLSQSQSSTPDKAVPTPAARGSAEVLKGTWVRPDGGYRIVIAGIGPGGKLDATYFNPSRLPFASAQLSQDGSTFRVLLELQSGGYAGSTYNLVYEPMTDRLQGTFYQAVAKQTFNVVFVRN